MRGLALSAPLVLPARTRRRPPVAPTRRPLVSVVVPCFDYARYLPAAVHSALAQDGVDVDVVVVDDCSRDDSLAVAHGLAADDARVRVVAHETNQGPVATFNDGLAAARGEYLVRLDADDVLTPRSLARATALAEAHPEVAMVYGHPLHFTGDRLPAHRERVAAWTVWSGRDWLTLRCRLGVNCITSPEVLMRMSVVREVGGQRPLRHTHDMEMWLRLARAGDVGWLRGPDQAWHREHDRSLSATDVDVLTDLTERAEAFEVLLTDGGGDPDLDRAALRQARTALADEALVRVCQAHVSGHTTPAEVAAHLDLAAHLAAGLTDGPGDGLDALPHAGRLRRSRAAGIGRARTHPDLLLAAVGHRAERELRRRLWKHTGL